MAIVKTYKELLVWQKGISLVSKIYKVTEDFPRRETYGLTDQIRRASVSIPSNIAEGFGRRSKAEMGRYIQIALGSLYELETQLILASNLNYMPINIFQEIVRQISELDAMLQSFSFNLRHPKIPNPKTNQS